MFEILLTLSSCIFAHPSIGFVVLLFLWFGWIIWGDREELKSVGWYGNSMSCLSQDINEPTLSFWGQSLSVEDFGSPAAFGI